MKWQYAHVVYILCTLIGSATATAQCAPVLSKVPARGGYVKFCHSPRVIVFVHGFTSNPEVWRNQETGNYWPTLIAEDPSPKFRNTDVYVVGYDTPSSGGKMTMSDLVTEIVNRMDHANVFADHREVVFIAHSMGGLLTQELLLTYAADHKLAPKIDRIFLYGAPLEGSPVANWAKFFKSDPLVKELQSGGDNFILQSLDQRWLHSNFAQTKRYCAYEIQPEHGFKVVDRNSATRGCNDQQAIDVDHHHLVEPADREADAYIFVSNRLDPVSTQTASNVGPIPISQYAAPAQPPATQEPEASTVARLQSLADELQSLANGYYPNSMSEYAEDHSSHPEYFGGKPLTPDEIEVRQTNALQSRYDLEKSVNQQYAAWAGKFRLARQDVLDCTGRNHNQRAEDDKRFRAANERALVTWDMNQLKKDHLDADKFGLIFSYVKDLATLAGTSLACGR